MTSYVVKSGMPKGEVYHWETYKCNSLEIAQECQGWMLDISAEEDDWLWGPRIYPLDSDEMPLAWNGYEMVEAPEWDGEPWIDYSGKSQN